MAKPKAVKAALERERVKSEEFLMNFIHKSMTSASNTSATPKDPGNKKRTLEVDASNDAMPPETAQPVPKKRKEDFDPAPRPVKPVNKAMVKAMVKPTEEQSEESEETCIKPLMPSSPSRLNRRTRRAIDKEVDNIMKAPTKQLRSSRPVFERLSERAHSDDQSNLPTTTLTDELTDEEPLPAKSLTDEFANEDSLRPRDFYELVAYVSERIYA